MDRLFIKPQYFQMLLEVFDSYCPKAEIWAYGSRINGRAHDGSDLDMVVKSFNEDGKSIYKLRELVSDSYVPFLTDIHEFESMPESFQAEILRDYVVIYPVSKE